MRLFDFGRNYAKNYASIICQGLLADYAGIIHVFGIILGFRQKIVLRHTCNIRIPTCKVGISFRFRQKLCLVHKYSFVRKPADVFFLNTPVTTPCHSPWRIMPAYYYLA